MNQSLTFFKQFFSMNHFRDIFLSRSLEICIRHSNCYKENSSFCERSKASVAPCQEEVELATRPDTIVSCSSAQWICAADPLCSTALDYYNRFCRAMFRGKKCTKRCHNSISILRRQKAAKKLG